MSPFRNDEAASEDALDRQAYAEALARVAVDCEPPLTVGVFGGWGTGKTTLMQLVRSELDRRDDVRTVWFNAWQHQYDEHPSVGLVQAVACGLGLDRDAQVRKLLTVIALGLMAPVLRGGLSLSEIERLGEKYEDERFLTLEHTARLQEYFERLIGRVLSEERSTAPSALGRWWIRFRQLGGGGAARGSRPVGRLVIFIDDLDRCRSDAVLKVLESLRLFLNQRRTVCFLGVDQLALRAIIQQRYQGGSEVNYLDKIVQLPFHLPPIDGERMAEYTSELLPARLKSAAGLVTEALRRNPRAIKRFVNQLQLAHHVWLESLESRHGPMDSRVMATVLVLQQEESRLFAALGDDPDKLTDLAAGEEVVLSDVDGDPLELAAHLTRLVEGERDAIDAVEPGVLPVYFHLTELSGPETAAPTPTVARSVPAKPTESLTKAELAAHPSVERLLGRPAENPAFFLLLRTKAQRTWLMRTEGSLVLLLDDRRTRSTDKVAQWSMPRSEARPITTRPGRKKLRVVDIGPRRGWLYNSGTLHRDPAELVQKLEAFVHDEGPGFDSGLP